MVVLVGSADLPLFSLHYPAQSFAQVSSQLQTPQTLMTCLGLATPAEASARATDPFQSEDVLVPGKDTYLAIENGHRQLVFPFTGSKFFRYDVYDVLGRRLPRNQRRVVVEASKAVLDRVVKGNRGLVRLGFRRSGRIVC